MTVSNAQVARLINDAADDLDIALVVHKARTETRDVAGKGRQEVAIFTLAMPDMDDPDLTMTLECTGRELRFLWAGMQLAHYGEATWLAWDRPARVAS